MPLSCPLRFFTQEPCPRRGEPVTVGLPWPRGAVADEKFFHLIGPDGVSQPLQTRVLDRWPDGSVRWCLFDFLAKWDGVTAESEYRLEVGVELQPPQVPFQPTPTELNLSVGYNQEVDPRSDTGRTWSDLFPPAGTQSLSTDSTLDAGPIRCRRSLKQEALIGLQVIGHVDDFMGSAVRRVQLTIRNPNPADHPGGNWDLGNGGSIFFDSIFLGWYGLSADGLRISLERTQPFRPGDALFTRVYQQSSGGNNWRSSNHITCTRSIPFRSRGYEWSIGDEHGTGERATPILVSDAVGVCHPQFWENFPGNIVWMNDGIAIWLFAPQDQGKAHELQGGEQKTHTFYVASGKDTITDEPMVWCRSPIVCHADPEWYAASGAIPYLTPKAGDPHAAYLALVDQALDGPDTFVHKREKIDEYGWRNFGDIYGDHEAVYHKGETPLISHYNNQYDCVAGFLWQFFRSGDLRWLAQGLECADHTCDIDIYHTDGDKAAYNGGLFWHTYHYADADTGNHRSYPKSITRGPVESLTQNMDQLGETGKHLQKSYAVGGGPASSNNYNLGLMLAYFLTGNPLYRDGALELADFVINMDDPRRTPFRFLSREYTGLASESGGGVYHGPGRGPANSILASIVGHQLTGDPKYLAKAEQVLRRVVHPKQNLDRLDLLNAELRWFYTMTLQAVGWYLDYKVELDQLDENYAYARLALLHYARWMAVNERPILATPEKLQYPTETWAAQDMRKVEVFQYAAKHATGEERVKFLERAAWFFDYVQTTLSVFETKSLCRPVILMMTNGWSRNWWRLNPQASAPEPRVKKTVSDFGEWTMFVGQKAKAIKRAKLIVLFGGVAAVVGLVAAVWWLLR